MGVTVALDAIAVIEREHTIRLYFSELQDFDPSGRIFSVSL